MSETEKQFQNELNSLDVKMQKEVYDEAMDNAFLGSVQKIEHPEIAALKQRIADLEQQLKTARADAVREFIPTIKAMDEPAYLKGRFQAELFWRGAFAAQKLAEEYVNNLEGR